MIGALGSQIIPARLESANKGHDPHPDDVEYRRATRALHLVEEHSPGSINRLRFDEYEELDKALIREFRRISQEGAG